MAIWENGGVPLSTTDINDIFHARGYTLVGTTTEQELKSKCVDDPFFRDGLGRSCLQLHTVGCHGVGDTLHWQEDRCPRTCGQCTPVGEPAIPLLSNYKVLNFERCKISRRDIDCVRKRWPGGRFAPTLRRCILCPTIHSQVSYTSNKNMNWNFAGFSCNPNILPYSSHHLIN
jgi:hypothetical protein